MESSTPLSHWIGFHLYIVALLAIELIFARRHITLPPGQSATEATASTRAHLTSVVASILWIVAALAFAGFVHYSLGSAAAVQYVAGYTLEESLSIDNLFVFLILFRLFKVPPSRQPRVLFWGVAGAIVMRGSFIAAGISLLSRFGWVSYIFALILLAAAIRLLLPSKGEHRTASPRWVAWLSRIHPVSLRTDHFFVRELDTSSEPPQIHRMVTMLTLCLIAIELTDVVFALDSIPAVLSITRQPFLAYTSNIMAVMGLRSLFFLLAHLLTKLRYLHYGLSAVLAFAAFKMLATPWIDITPLIALAVIVIVLGITTIVSILHPKTVVSPQT